MQLYFCKLYCMRVLKRFCMRSGFGTDEDDLRCCLPGCEIRWVMSCRSIVTARSLLLVYLFCVTVFIQGNLRGLRL